MNAPFPLADTLSAAPLAAPSDSAASVRAAATALLPHLERGQRVDTAILRDAMETAFGASDATGLWNWKTAYEACEVATVLFLRKYGKALFRKAGSPVAALPLLGKIAGLLPTHTRRSQESQALQQFSTPIPLGLVAATAAAITSADRVLEPSAGTGLLAILAELAGGSLVLNELADTRAALLSSLFPAIPVTRFDAAQIDDHLDPAVMPSVVLMNPPFSVMANVEGRMPDAAYRHVASAHRIIGRVYMAQGKVIEALEAFDEAMRHAPMAIDTHVRRAEALIALGRRQEAAMELEEIAELGALPKRLEPAVKKLRDALGG